MIKINAIGLNSQGVKLFTQWSNTDLTPRTFAAATIPCILTQSGLPKTFFKYFQNQRWVSSLIASRYSTRGQHFHDLSSSIFSSKLFTQNGSSKLLARVSQTVITKCSRELSSTHKKPGSSTLLPSYCLPLCTYTDIPGTLALQHCKKLRDLRSHRTTIGVSWNLFAGALIELSFNSNKTLRGELISISCFAYNINNFFLDVVCARR